jgi:molybdopterin-guanine dinucleotide biosynthesis protein B
MIPVVCVAGFSGSGKTTLLEKLIPWLTAHGWKINVVKHTHHVPTVDKPGSDSDRLFRAGASEMILASASGSFHRFHNQQPENLDELRERLDGYGDLIIAEGFKWADYPKIIVHRTATGKPFPGPEFGEIIAVVGDAPDDFDGIVFTFEQVAEIGEMIEKRFLPQQTR